MGNFKLKKKEVVEPCILHPRSLVRRKGSEDGPPNALGPETTKQLNLKGARIRTAWKRDNWTTPFRAIAL